MIANWKDPEKTKPPKGVPLIVTIKRNWQHWTETLGPVYFMQSPWDGKTEFRTHGDWDGVIGPDSIKVTLMPDIIQSLEMIIDDKMTQLSEAYTEAYDAAYKSMDGQFKLFEEAPELTQQSVDQMIAALQSQAVYMQEYTANLKAAGEMGLSQGLIAQLSDGSKESAAYLAAIVSDGATKIDELNTAFSSVEEGKAEFANTVAEMETDFSAQMAALQADLEATVAAMDMSSDAASAGAATVQASADGAAGKLSAVTAAFQKVAAAAAAAMNVELPGHAAGTDNAERGFAWVGERGPELMWFNGGDQVMTAQDSRNFMRQATSAEPVQAISDRSGGSHYNIEVKPEFNITGSSNPAETEALMQQQTERMRDMIEQVFDDIESDRARRVYTR